MARDKTRQRVRDHLHDEAQGPPELRALRFEPIVREAVRWCEEWGHDRLEDEEVEAACDVNAASFRLWHEPIGGRGIAQLQSYAVRQIDGDAARGFDLAHQAWERTFTSLSAARERHQAGKSLPNFRVPASRLNADNVTSYLRKGVRWARNNLHRTAGRDTPLDEERIMRAKDGSPVEEIDLPEGPVWSIALRFACLWFIVDAREQPDHWWAMALHALGIKAEGFDPRGGSRNHPQRAEHKLLVRLRAALGLGPWLRQWVAFQGDDWWDSGQQPVPRRITEDLPLDAVRDALDRIRPAIAQAELEDVAPAQRKALVAILVKNRHVAGQLPHFPGGAPDDRLDALCRLAERAGAEAADQLAGRKAGGSPGSPLPPCGHDRATMRSVHGGAPPTPPQMARMNDQLSSCDDCREWWLGMCEGAEHLTGAAEAMVRLEIAPVRQRSRSLAWLLIPAAAAAAAALLVVFSPWKSPTPEEGDRPDQLVDGDTQIKHLAEVSVASLTASALDADSQVAQVSPGEGLPAGTRLTFELGAPKRGYLYLLHRAPDGRLTQLDHASDGEPLWVGGTGPITDTSGAPFEFVLPDQPGRHQVVVTVVPQALQIKETGDVLTALPDLAPENAQQAWAAWLGLVGFQSAQVAVFDLEVTP